MENKHKLDNTCKITYFIYGILLIYPLQSLIKLGILSKDIRSFEIISNIKIGYSIEFYAFWFLFLLLLSIGIKSDLKNIEIFDDEEKLKKLKKSTLPYKLFITVNIIGMLSLVLFTKDKELLIPSILLIYTSILIHYAKESYIKSYLFDRKLNYLEKINGDKYNDSNIDTKKWRYKIWYNNKEKIKISDRIVNIIIDIFSIIFFGIFFVVSGLVVGTILYGYILIINIFKLIEDVFSLYTTIDGVCTGVYEQRTRNHTYYKVVVTDYTNKREIKVKLKEDYYIGYMDNLSVVHGVLSKQAVSINNIKINKYQIGNIIPLLIFIIIFVISTINNYTYKDNIESMYYKDSYLDYEERQKLENDKELLELNQLGKYKTIDISKEQEFNDVIISFDKLYLGKKASKIYFSITNNTDKGMVINVDYNTIIKDDEGKNSNILLPGKKYDLEMDILQEYNKKSYNTLLVNLEYTLSETILNEYLDFTYYNHYPLNVIDNDCMTYINLETNEVDMNFNNYNEFYTKNSEIVKFKY